MTTISLPLAIWGTGYSEFLPRWWDGVASLQRQPNEIVIVTDQANAQAALESLRALPIPTRVIPFNGNNYAEFWNKAIAESTSDWIAICNVDDMFLPEALNQIDQADDGGYNLVCDSIQDKDSNNVVMSSWDQNNIGTNWSMVGAEPMRKDLWQAAGGFRPGYLFADWALAMDMAKTNKVKAFDASTIRIIYDRGHNRKTLSGVMQDSEAKVNGYKMLRQLAQELGLN